MDLTTPLTYVKGIGPARAAMLEAKGLTTVEDLLGYVPFRYEDRSNMKPIAQLAPGEMATVIAEVRSVKMSGFKRRSLGMFEARFTDASRAILVGKWFHGGYLANVLAEGMKVALFGKVEFDSLCRRTHHAPPGVRNSLRRRGRGRGHAARGARGADLRRHGQTHHQDSAHPDASHPAGASIRWTTRCPQFLRDRLKMPDRWTALRDIHFPPPETDLRLLNAFRTPAQFRLIYEEFFWLECGVALKRSKARAVPGHRVRTERPRPRAREGDAAVQADGRAEARAEGDRRRHGGAASDEPPAAGRRGQRQDDRGRRSRGDRHRERLSGGGAGADGDPGHAAQLHLQADSRQAGLRHRAADRAASPGGKRCSSRSWCPRGWCTWRSARTR